MAESDFRADRPIVLVGLMGAGKSSVGPRLAARLRVPFADVDREIERSEGLAVAEIFDRLGEAHFRRLEGEAIARLSDGPPCVIAAGGGAFVDADNRRLLLDRCRVIWLDADAATLADRVRHDGDRPLLRGGDPHATLTGLMEQRGPLYAEAHFRIGADPPVDRVVDLIVAALATGR